MVSCSVSNCDVTRRNNPSNYTFHRFPSNPELRDKWIQIINRHNWTPHKNSTLCSKHFEQKCFIQRERRRVLFKESIPTLFVPINLPKRRSVTSYVHRHILPSEERNSSPPSIAMAGPSNILSLRKKNKRLKQKIREKNRVLRNLKARMKRMSKRGIELQEVVKEFNNRPGLINHRSDVEVCRICLAQDRMLYDIDACNLKRSYERLTDCLVTEDALPQMLCWECKARLLSFDNFRAKALRSRALLSNMAPFTQQDIIEKLQSVDLREHDIVSSLTSATLENHFEEKHDLSSEMQMEDIIENHQSVDRREPDLVSSLRSETLENHTEEKQDLLSESQIKRETQMEEIYIKTERHDSDASETETECTEFYHEVKCERLNPDIADMLDVTLEEQPHTSSTECTRKRKLTLQRDPIKMVKQDQGPNYNIENRFKCEKCRKSFALKADMENHLYTHSLLDLCNKAAEKELTCVQCKTICQTRLLLLEHMKLKHNIMSFSCGDCDFKSDDANILVEHEVMHNQNRIYKCVICRYRAVQYEHLKQHVMTVHSQEKPFRCNLCDYRCTRKCNLKLHERTHTGERPYKCDECDYAAAQPTTLKQHILSTHAPDKPIKCKYCSYTCSQKCDMVRHERIHTGEKPFVCTHCNYRTARSNDLQQHLLRIHAGEKSYACDLCSYTATAKANLRKHRLRMHMKESINVKLSNENALKAVEIKATRSSGTDEDSATSDNGVGQNDATTATEEILS